MSAHKILQGLREAIAYARGDMDAARVTKVTRKGERLVLKTDGDPVARIRRLPRPPR